ncbi:MAG: hypothetical protein QOK51_00500 [Nitrososphaeraceae archaeon]|nr:hypothetical protein [Nitrososphaeraceae archaeon]MDW0202609.1 hypothetical protein [Nitrososphaeraceae archaeon]MDW0207302.1 hypothetical protein [Nitrososphaeraceae archaeon]MDW0220500.1 hypothetical protein [Nitrososphaeraceae archaeon]MDW0221882.1 hypothetical protein [Nitrososphaeraceae archaeon]
MDIKRDSRRITTLLLIMVLSGGLMLSNSGHNSIKATSSNPIQISNNLVKDTYLTYVKLKTSQDKGDKSECDPGVGHLQKEDLQKDDALCNPGLENMKNKLADDNKLDEKLVNKLSKNIEKKETVVKDRLEKLKERMEKAISEEEEKEPIPLEEKKKVDADDQKSVEEHEQVISNNCRDGNVLDGASNAEDLKVLAECQEAVGDVMHTKKMDDGDYKFLLKLEDKYEFLINDKNDEKTDGLLVVEVVPGDQDLQNVVLPAAGDKVHIWGAWVTDEPKGWHEIHPTWQVTKE